jgi:hypothetical protein
VTKELVTIKYFLGFKVSVALLGKVPQFVLQSLCEMLILDYLVQTYRAICMM